MEYHVFPSYFPYSSHQSQFVWAILTASAFFISVYIHEMAHILAEKKIGLPIRNRVLFPFGGVATCNKGTQKNDALISVSLSGPIASIVLASLYHLLYSSAIYNRWPVQLTIACQYLTNTNIFLACINILPLPPLDGGIALNQIVHSNRIAHSTHLIKSLKALSFLSAILLSIVLIYRGFLLSGIWIIIASISIKEGLQCKNKGRCLKEIFREARSGNYLRQNPITVQSGITLNHFVNHYIYRYQTGIFPVVDNRTIRGFILTSRVKNIPEHQWNNLTVADLTTKWQETNIITSTTNLLEVIKLMHTLSISRLLAIDLEEISGVITFKDLLHYLTIRLNLKMDIKKAPLSNYDNGALEKYD